MSTEKMLDLDERVAILEGASFINNEPDKRVSPLTILNIVLDMALIALIIKLYM